ncbi:MAG: hypothetical protein AB1333_00665 [Patescibacteria group bacterium]
MNPLIWVFIFSFFALSFGLALISLALCMRFEKKRVFSGISFLFFILMSFSTAYFGAQYVEQKIENNLRKESIEKLERWFREKPNLPPKEKLEINRVRRIS